MANGKKNEEDKIDKESARLSEKSGQSDLMNEKLLATECACAIVNSIFRDGNLTISIRYKNVASGRYSNMTHPIPT